MITWVQRLKNNPHYLLKKDSFPGCHCLANFSLCRFGAINHAPQGPSNPRDGRGVCTLLELLIILKVILGKTEVWQWEILRIVYFRAQNKSSKWTKTSVSSLSWLTDVRTSSFPHPPGHTRWWKGQDSFSSSSVTLRKDTEDTGGRPRVSWTLL